MPLRLDYRLKMDKDGGVTFIRFKEGWMGGLPTRHTIHWHRCKPVQVAYLSMGSDYIPLRNSAHSANSSMVIKSVCNLTRNSLQCLFDIRDGSCEIPQAGVQRHDDH